MSVEHMAVVLNHSRAVGTAKLLLLGIANHAGDGGAWPSMRTLARYANVDVRSVRRALRQLEELGELRVMVQDGGSAFLPDYRRPNRYDVLVSCPSWCDRTPQHRDMRVVDSALWSGNRPPDVSVRGPRTSASPGPRTSASPGPRTSASPEPSGEPPPQPRPEGAGPAIHSSDGEYGDGLVPAGFQPDLFDDGR